MTSNQIDTEEQIYLYKKKKQDNQETRQADHTSHGVMAISRFNFPPQI